LGSGVWAELTITGKLTQKGLDKLQGYVELLDAEDEEIETESQNKPPTGS
jgi:hypothetical protein